MHTYTAEDQAQIEMYAHNCAWKARLAKKVDLFIDLGQAVGRNSLGDNM